MITLISFQATFITRGEFSFDREKDEHIERGREGKEKKNRPELLPSF